MNKVEAWVRVKWPAIVQVTKAKGTGAPTGRALQDLLCKARAVGSWRAHWRLCTSTLSAQGSATGSAGESTPLEPQVLEGLPKPVQKFFDLYYKVQATKTKETGRAISYRVQMVRMWKEFERVQQVKWAIELPGAWDAGAHAITRRPQCLDTQAKGK